MKVTKHDLRQSWHLAIPGIAALMLAAGIIFPLPASQPFTSDSAIYHYGGLLLAKGYAPYLYMWDIKPPLIYLTTGAIALLAPGNGMLQVYLGQMLVGVFVAVTASGVAGIIHARTGEQYAAVAAALVIIAYPQFVTPASSGLRAAHGAVAFGIVSLWLMETDRFKLAIAAATIAAGYWPVAVITPIIVLIEAWRSGHRLSPLVTILAGVTAVCITPIALRGAFIPMVNEVLFGPLIKGEAGGPLQHLRQLFRIGSHVFVLWAVGGVASFEYIERSLRRRQLVDGWWIPTAGAFSGLWLLFLDFDGSVDLFLIAAIASVGVGVAVGRLSRQQQISAILVVLAVIAAAWIPAHGWITKQRTGDPGDTAYHDHLIEQRVPPESCHMRIGGGERKWMKMTGETAQSDRCGVVNPIVLVRKVI